MIRRHRRSSLFPYTTLFRSVCTPAWASIARTRGCCSKRRRARSEEHTSELQSRENLVCRLLLEKKNRNPYGVCDLMTTNTGRVWSGAGELTQVGRVRRIERG